MDWHYHRGLLGPIILLVVGVYAVSASRLGQTYEVTADFNLTIPTDAESIAAGEKLTPFTVRAVTAPIWLEWPSPRTLPLAKSTAPT
jgi:hypothetical protein